MILNFYLTNITTKYCKKASNKLRALARVTPYMAIWKKKVLMNSFFDSQFNYCPLVWICHSRKERSS